MNEERITTQSNQFYKDLMIDENRLQNVDYRKMYTIIIECHKAVSRRVGLDIDDDMPLTNFQYTAEFGQYFEPIWPRFFAMLYANYKCNGVVMAQPVFTIDVLTVINTVVTDPTTYVPVLIDNLEKSLEIYNQFQAMEECARKYTGYIKYLKSLLTS